MSKTPSPNTHITQQQLESYLWGAATLLRGVIDAGDYKQYIFPLLFFKRICDVYDEEFQRALDESEGDVDYAAFAENHRFQIPEGSHWRDVRNHANNVGTAIQRAMREIEQANPNQLYGIFGDAQWTNKDRLSDATLRDLVEHFSSLILSVANVPEDELGQAYEYLIKKFADDSGHTAAEFYTNRTVVHLMTLMLDPQPDESIYDPTCGSGGMLLSAVAELRRQGKEYRTLKLYGQERNLITSAITRMNLFLHGIEDFHVERGDTLAEPKFIEGDHLRRFDMVLANPPYSIKQWNRSSWEADPYGRNIYGVPPQGRADLDTLVMDADVLADVFDLKDPQKTKELEIKIIARLRKHKDRPQFIELGRRLEELKERHEQGLLINLAFVKQLLEIARDVVEAEKEVDPIEEQDRGKAALTELFIEVRNGKTSIMVERIVNDIDDIVRIVRFPGWQQTIAGDREVKQALRKTLLKYKLHQEQDLFDRAYAYIQQYY